MGNDSKAITFDLSGVERISEMDEFFFKIAPKFKKVNLRVTNQKATLQTPFHKYQELTSNVEELSIEFTKVIIDV